MVSVHRVARVGQLRWLGGMTGLQTAVVGSSAFREQLVLLKAGLEPAQGRIAELELVAAQGLTRLGSGRKARSGHRVWRRCFEGPLS